MQWSRQQTAAIDKVADWLRNSDQQVFRLFGYAGSGKTTLAMHLAAGVEGSVLFAAFTGKAAYVMQQRGCEGATTIHSLIYNPAEKGRKRLAELEESLIQLKEELKAENDGELPDNRRLRDLKAMIKQEKDALARPLFNLDTESPVKYAKLVVIDECSMVDENMGRDLCSFGTKILVLGDPAQLPPIGGGGYFTEQTPDTMLEETHRQASDNPIIDMATRVRRGDPLPLGNYGESRVVTSGTVKPEEALAADQILVGRNATRFSSNNRIRQLKGLARDLPVAGDKLVCLRNNHDLGLLNGGLWTVVQAGDDYDSRMLLEVRPELGGDSIEVGAHTHYFRGEKPEWWDKKSAEEFDYGYALTTHKAQGSQWPNVLLFDESHCFRKDAKRWLYTAITRAQERITISR